MRLANFLLLFVLMISAQAAFGEVICVRDPYTGRWINPHPEISKECKIPSSGSSSSTSSSPSSYPVGYIPFVSEFLNMLSTASARSAENARRKAALQAQLEAERKEAAERHQAEEVARLDAILNRLSSTLKGLRPPTELQLKLSPLGPVKFGEFMATPATSTTSAQITLKTGDDATRSLQTQTGNVSSAGTINPTPPTPLQAPNTEQLSPEAKELAEMLSKLTPEQQRRLLASMKSAETQAATTETQTQQTAAQPAGGSPELTKKSETLTLKLSTDQKTADDLKAAVENGANPDQLKQQADDQLKQLQQTTLTAAQTTSTTTASNAQTVAGPPQPNRPSFGTAAESAARSVFSNA